MEVSSEEYMQVWKEEQKAKGEDPEETALGRAVDKPGMSLRLCNTGANDNGSYFREWNEHDNGSSVWIIVTVTGKKKCTEWCLLGY